MRFKVGDRVRVSHMDSERFDKEIIGAIGIIVDVDPEWIYPYEIDFEDEEMKKYNSDLFLERELLLVGEEKRKSQSKYIDINLQKDFNDTEGASIEEVIDVLISKVKEINNDGTPTLNTFMVNSNIISRLVEARLWVQESRRLFNDNEVSENKDSGDIEKTE